MTSRQCVQWLEQHVYQRKHNMLRRMVNYPDVAPDQLAKQAAKLLHTNKVRDMLIWQLHVQFGDEFDDNMSLLFNATALLAQTGTVQLASFEKYLLGTDERCLNKLNSVVQDVVLELC